MENVHSIIDQPQFICKKCEKELDIHTQLKKHEFTEHSRKVEGADNSSIPIRHSTINMTEEIICCGATSINVNIEEGNKLCDPSLSEVNGKQDDIFEDSTEDGDEQKVYESTEVDEQPSLITTP